VAAPDTFKQAPILALLDADEQQILAQPVSVGDLAKGGAIFCLPGGF